MASVAQQIYALLETAFAPTQLEVIDDSAKHAGHAGARAGGQSHFTVKIESPAFAGMGRLARHRAVYAPLQPLFDRGLHALTIEANIPE